MRRLWLIILLLIVSVSAKAQETAEDYLLYKLEQESHQEFSITTDTLLFYRALQRCADLYDELAMYRFSSVENSRRGFYYTYRKAMLEGVEMRHQNISILRRLGVSERGYAGLNGDYAGMVSAAGADYFSLSDGAPISGGNVALFLTGKGYLGGVRATLNSLMRDGWSLSTYASAKGGNDLYVKGVYNNTIDVGLRLSKDFSYGATLSLVVLSSVGERGLRSGSTQESFTLTGDRLYNPTWGRQDGKVRNSRQRRDAIPFIALVFDSAIGNSTRMNFSVGGDYGRRGYTSLGWYDAMTPRPDNYRYMPSYYADEAIAGSVADEWRRGNEKYTQIDWNDLYTQNRRSADGAVYAVEERVEQIANSQLSLQFTTYFGREFQLNYGVRAWRNSSRQYKQMDDLLGAYGLKDIDYYLIDDDTYSNNLQNNLLNPDRYVGDGDRFSYDYSLVDRGVTANIGFEYNTSRWQIDASLAIGGNSIFRKGYYEKELFAGDKSLGRSVVSHFAPYTFKVSAGYAFSVHHNLDFAMMLSTQTPDAEDLFLNPMYNNRVVDNPSLRKERAVELNYKYHSSSMDLVVSAFAVRSSDERDMFRAYDDLSTTYCDVDISGIGIARYGVEAAVRAYLSSRLQLEMTAAVGEYKYVDNPIVSHYADSDNSVVCNSSISDMSGCRVGGAPQTAVSASMTYFARRGWIFSGCVNFAGGRYVDPSFVRRTERVARQGAMSEEIYERFLAQQNLGNATTVDCSVAKWFRVGQSRVSLSLMVNNLLGRDDIVYGGYESSRIRRYRSGAQMVYAPQDDIITYSYPRTLYGVVSWKF